jgi:tetratricopeptide (TPR) repeat protein
MHTTSIQQNILLRFLLNCALLILSYQLIALPLDSSCDTALIASLMKRAENTSGDSAAILYRQSIQMARECLASATKYEKNGKIKGLMIRAQIELGMIYYQNLEYDKSMQQYLPSLQMAKELANSHLVAECLFDIAEVYLEQNKYSAAMTFYGESLEKYEKMKDGSGIFWCYTGMGIVQKQTGNYSDAVICYNNALEAAKKAGLKNEEASCYNNLGNVYRKKGNYAEAMAAYQKAITTFKLLKDEMAASDCMNNIGNLYLDNGDPFRALDYYNQSLKIVKAENDEYRLIIRYKNLADAYTELKDYDNAELFLNDAMKLAQKSGDKSFLASCYMQSGKLQELRGEPEIAIAYYNKSYALSNQIGARAEQADALIEIANLELNRGKPNAAIEQAKRAESLAEQAGILKSKMEANLCLSIAYEKMGNTGEALRSLRKVLIYRDSIYSADKYRTIEEIEAGFVQRELKKQNSALSQNSILKDQAIRTRNIIMLLLLVCLILSGALIWLIYKRQREVKLETSRIQQLREKQIEKLNEDITTKERELTSKTIFINQKNQLLEKLIGELEELKETEVSGSSIHHLQVKLKQELSPNAWKEFEVQFNEVHPGFQNRLIGNYPGLTPAERRLCSFIRLDMNTREVSSLTGQSIKSIEVARTRIRKKLQVPHEHNLNNFIALI